MSYGVAINDDPNNIINELSRVKLLGGNAVQLFVHPNKKYVNIYKDFKKRLLELNMICFVHATYTVNMASEWNDYSWWIKLFISEIITAESINAIGIVIHMGKQLNLDISTAVNNMYSSLLFVHDKTKNLNVKILLETPAGQGSEIGFKLDDFAKFYNKFSMNSDKLIKKRFMVCVDTCHIFAAGYDITNDNKINMYLDEFEELVGIKNVLLVHLNDSKKDIGSRVDRHANVGNGYIGKKSLRFIAKYFLNYKINVIMETDSREHKREISLLRKIISAK